MKSKKRKGSNTVFIVMIITLFARVFGLLREILIARYYGTSVYTDAYIISNNIPTVLFDTLGQALLTSYIPMYSRARKEKDEIRANQFTIHLLMVLLLICIAATILGEIFTKEVVLLFASGFKGEALSITISFTRILFPSIFAMTLLNLFTGYLQVYEKFILSSFVTVIGNLVIIFSLILSSVFDNVYIFVWGSLVGLFSQVLFLVPSVISTGLFKAKIILFEKDEYVKLLIPLLLPVFAGTAVNEINSIVDRTMVSGLETGSVSVLNYAYKIISLCVTVVAMPLITVLYPKLSEHSAQDNQTAFNGMVQKGINVLLFIIIPVTVLVIAFRGNIIRLLFERGSFSGSDTIKSANALAFYGIGLITIALQQFLVRVFYSKQNTVTPMISGIICALTNIFLDYTFIKMLGASGAALATSMVSVLNCAILLFFLKKKGILSILITIKHNAKNILSGIIMAVLLFVGVQLTANIGMTGILHYLLDIVIAIISILLYLGVEILLKNRDAISFVGDIIRNKK